MKRIWEVHAIQTENYLELEIDDGIRCHVHDTPNGCGEYTIPMCQDSITDLVNRCSHGIGKSTTSIYPIYTEILMKRQLERLIGWYVSAIFIPTTS